MEKKLTFPSSVRPSFEPHLQNKNRIMQAWLPAHEALLEMMIYHLPSPATAQVRFLEEREANEREREREQKLLISSSSKKISNNLDF